MKRKLMHTLGLVLTFGFLFGIVFLSWKSLRT